MALFSLCAIWQPSLCLHEAEGVSQFMISLTLGRYVFFFAQLTCFHPISAADAVM